MSKSFDEENFPSADGAGPHREVRGFAPDQMVACVDCTRANPPTRMNCLYCGAALPAYGAGAALRRPGLRRVEEWEQGVNVIMTPGGGGPPPPEAFAGAADLLRSEVERVREMWSRGRPLPLARVASADEAGLIKERLNAAGMRVELLPDEVLAAESTPPKRVRRMNLGDDSLILRAGAGGEERTVEWEEITLLVRGRIFVKQLEVEERGAFPGAEKEMAAARELNSDEAVIDVHTKDFGGGWRINADGFDYSCLGARKSLLAKDNFVTLADALRARAAAAYFDDDYGGLRHLLSPAWPLGERTESRGLRRERVGKFNAESVIYVSNEAQFTHYSRLCHHFQLRRGGSRR